MDEQKLKVDFSYTDEFGQESRMIKSYNECVLTDQTPMEFLLYEFKCFLLSAGYSEEWVNKIVFNGYDD